MSAAMFVGSEVLLSLSASEDENGVTYCDKTVMYLKSVPSDVTQVNLF